MRNRRRRRIRERHGRLFLAATIAKEAVQQRTVAVRTYGELLRRSDPVRPEIMFRRLYQVRLGRSRAPTACWFNVSRAPPRRWSAS